ncbi:MAG TPA: hypothetical protein ENK06_10485 [Gammaproteobacteria bacterium]|nr:hypothetical protein [Gammaproteobacteria bacterium]
MKIGCCLFILLLSANCCLADELEGSNAGIDPNDLDGATYVDPYDVEGGVVILPEAPVSSDPYDQPEFIEHKEKKKPAIVKFKDKLLVDADASWRAWKKRNLKSPKPPLNWSQVGAETGAGYVGAFGGSVVGLFGGFLAGSLYDAVSNCDRCWVDVAVNMSTLGAGLGTAAGVYMFGNNEEQLGSISATYLATVLPVLVGTVAYTDSRQINKSGFYLLTMPLFAVVGYNLTRYHRGENDKPLFDNIFIDDMWVSKNTGEVLALNVKFTF